LTVEGLRMPTSTPWQSTTYYKPESRVPNPDPWANGRDSCFGCRVPVVEDPNRRQPRGRLMVSLVNSHKNATRIWWHLLEIVLGFAPGLPPGWKGTHLNSIDVLSGKERCAVQRVRPSLSSAPAPIGIERRGSQSPRFLLSPVFCLGFWGEGWW